MRAQALKLAAPKPLGVLALMLLSGIAQAHVIFTCPVVTIRDDLSAPLPPGWIPPPPGDVGEPNPWNWRVDHVEFFSGDPKLRNAIPPATSHVNENGGKITWYFPKSGAIVWLGCHYESLMLVRPLPAGTKISRVTSIVSTSSNKIECR